MIEDDDDDDGIDGNDSGCIMGYSVVWCDMSVYVRMYVSIRVHTYMNMFM